jgi:branched-subunit amino acid aminotransferase/4-amino-4-deoxychorismate lyase
VPDLERERLDRGDVAEAEELMAINAVRGVVAIVELDGRPVGGGRPGPRAGDLRRVSASEGMRATDEPSTGRPPHQT